MAVGVAGLGAVGSFVFWSLYRGWLKLNIFANLTPEQTFSLMRWFLLLTFLSLLAILATYLASLASKSTPAAEQNLLEEVLHQARAYVDETQRESALRDEVERLNHAIATKQDALDSVQQRLATAKTQLQVEELTRQNKALRDEVDSARSSAAVTKERLDALQQALPVALTKLKTDYADVLSSETGGQSSGSSPVASSGSSATLAERLSSNTVAAWDKCVRAAGNKVTGEQPNCEAILRQGVRVVMPSR